MKNREVCIQMIQEVQDDIAILTQTYGTEEVHPINMQLQKVINFVQSNL